MWIPFTAGINISLTSLWKSKLSLGLPRLRLGCTLVCILIILACGAYLGAGLLLLSAVQNQPPAP